MTSQPIAPRPPLRLMFASLLRADLLVLVRNRRGFMLSVALPIVFLILLRSNKAATHLGGDLFVIGLVITIGLVNHSIVGYALTVARDRDQGIFQRLRVTPVPTWTIMASRLAVSTLANLLIAVVAVVVGTRMHNVNPSAAEYALVLLVSVLGGAVFLAIGQALVGLLKSADTVNAGARILVIVLIFGGIFGQSGTLGSGWESIARWSPVGAVITLFAGVLDLSAWGSRDTLSLVACISYIAVFATLGIRWFRWDSR